MAIKYLVKKNKIDAYLGDTKNDVLDEITKITKGIVIADVEMKDGYCGTAHCSNEDNFDFNVGSKIAKKRCLAKYYKNKIKIYKDLSRMYLELAEICVKRVKRLQEIKKNYEEQ